RDSSGMPVASFERTGPRRDARTAPRAGAPAPGAGRPGPSFDTPRSRSERPAPRGERPSFVTAPRPMAPSRPATPAPVQPSTPVVTASAVTTPSEVRFREVSPATELTSFAQLQLRPETRAAVDAMGI